MIPGLENAEFVRYGVMHRNTYLNSPDVLSHNFSVKGNPFMRFAGQITGVEGYMESTASGLVAGISLAKRLLGEEEPVFTGDTVLGALTRHVVSPTSDFQPMNANFGILDKLEERVRGKRNRYEKMAEKSLNRISEIKSTYNL